MAHLTDTDWRLRAVTFEDWISTVAGERNAYRTVLEAVRDGEAGPAEAEAVLEAVLRGRAVKQDAEDVLAEFDVVVPA